MPENRPKPWRNRFYWLAEEDVAAATRLLGLLTRADLQDRGRGVPDATELEDFARSALALRHRRIKLMGDMFATEAPFAMLLSLYAGRASGVPQTAAELTASAGLTPSTLLRWLAPLVAQGWLVRTRGSDARKAQISLTPQAEKALDELFRAFL